MKRILVAIALAIAGLAAAGADGRFVGSWDVRGMAYVGLDEQGDGSVPKAWTEQGLEPMPFATFRADGSGTALTGGEGEPFTWRVEGDMVYLTRQYDDPMPARFQFVDRDTVLILEESGTVVNVAVLKRVANR